MSLEVLIFLLGQLSAVALQLLVSRLALRREQRKEAWIRRLNSYENFYRASTQLIDLFQANVEVPQSSAWESIADARKAAYDASSYDPGNPGRTARMREVSLDLVRLSQAEQRSTDTLDRLRNEAEQIRTSFYGSLRGLEPGPNGAGEALTSK